jgi:hypothetical protein
VTIHGTYSSAAGAFEISDDSTNWYPSFAAGLGGDDFYGSGFGQGGSTLTNTSVSFLVSTGGGSSFRTRLTAISGGSISVRITPISNARPQTIASQLFLKSASSNSLAAIGGNQPLDGVTNSSLNPSLNTNSFISGFNGTTWDRIRTYGTGILATATNNAGSSNGA